MKKRVITGLIIGIVYIATIFLSAYVHKVFFDIFVLLIALFSGLEICKAMSAKFGKPIELLVVLTAIFGYLGFYLIQHIGAGSGGITAYFGVLAVMFLICILYTMLSKKQTIRNAVSTMMAMCYPISVLVYMMGLNYLKLPIQFTAILLMFAVSSFTDTFAYIVGSTVKGPKLCPKISPKKTISGAIGGLLGGILGSLIIMVFAMFGILNAKPLSSIMSLNILHFIIIGLLGAFFTQIGDLIASFLKRSCEIKDFGNLLPGHGGVLDRIDGMMVNAVFLYIYLTFLMW